ncbi:TetR/AcrR family transcriptional regulator [Nocardia yunnanensis]|uniref:TetR/AcrR family transcriptional regulator n=2 Tax=Nocardia yunnanensis TaxID=2382165 RepID=A0A386ZHU4_9NOCA|nr:TetR/AcrR family transcriptional regulator [Nocardia yunnanensis]
MLTKRTVVSAPPIVRRSATNQEKLSSPIETALRVCTPERSRYRFIAALSTLLESGVPFSDITIQQIAESAGISRPMFYYYFDDKYALLAHAFTARVPLEILARQQLGGWVSGSVQLHTALVEMARLIDRDRYLFAAALHVAGYRDDISEIFRTTCEAVRDALTDRIRSTQHPDSASYADPDLAAIGLTMSVRAMVRRLVIGDDEAETVTTLVNATTLIWDRVLPSRTVI